MTDTEYREEKDVIKILLVDDIEIIRERIKTLLKQIPATLSLIEAGDANEAVLQLISVKPDAVILDIRMPGRNGLELLKEIKKVCPSARTIILTNYPYPQYRKKCFELGADYFLSKSTEFENLLSIIMQIHIDSLNIREEKNEC